MRTSVSNLSPPHRQASYRRGNAFGTGFTLIEVLVSLTLLTIVVGSVYSTFHTVQRAINRFNGISLKYHEARTTLDFMRREIESSIFEPLLEEKSNENPTRFIIRDRDVFGKSTSALHFTAFSSQYNSVQNIQYYIEENEGHLLLFKKQGPAVLSEEAYTLELIEDIESFTVETLFDGKWVRTWNAEETGGIPERIRITIEFDDNGKAVQLTEYSIPRIGTQL